MIWSVGLKYDNESMNISYITITHTKHNNDALSTKYKIYLHIGQTHDNNQNHLFALLLFKQLNTTQA